ncbi:MAG: NAD(P)H-dependent oxidoreductase [Bacteroidales bacterium]|jgi:glutathione-regulated potassium-efflux system ancillary protein KefF|nr:NAD(P)H-dependent oxidoreductase [Bacteroidales bacterium]
MKKVTIIFAHPFFEQSVANREILSYLKKKHKDYEIRNLNKMYPDFHINVKKEQQVLLHSDIIVMQFPFFWYSVPAIMKEWMDTVLEHGFAFGTNGDKLHGKQFILSFTVGGTQSSYNPLGYNHFRIEEFLRMFEQTAYLSGMIYNGPIYDTGMRTIGGGADIDEVKQRAINQAKRLIKCIDKI